MLERTHNNHTHQAHEEYLVVVVVQCGRGGVGVGGGGAGGELVYLCEYMSVVLALCVSCWRVCVLCGVVWGSGSVGIVVV